MKTLTRTLVITCLALGLTSSMAFAQETTTTSDGGLGGSTSTSTTTTTAVAITVGPLVTTTMVAGVGGSAKMEAYLRNNSNAVQQDVRMGAGQTVNDLAQIFQVSDTNRAAFGKILRAHKVQLSGLATVSKLNRTRTDAFVKTIFSAMKKDGRFSAAMTRLAKQG